MEVFKLLRVLDPDLAPEDTKLHVAVHNGVEDPLDVFMAGEFPAWQEEQTRKNFGRPFILALIQLPGSGRWLYAGAFDSIDVRWDDEAGFFRYSTRPRPATETLVGRLVVEFHRKGRQSYLLAERWQHQLLVSELRPKRMRVPEFPGYRDVLLSKSRLDLIIREASPTWRGALTSVGGVYLIVDQASGQQYVGSATGRDGLWGRWSSYSASGHGGNRELRRVLDREGPERAASFQFSILEVFDPETSVQTALDRESRWKEVLGSRAYGLNAN